LEQGISTPCLARTDGQEAEAALFPMWLAIRYNNRFQLQSFRTSPGLYFCFQCPAHSSLLREFKHGVKKHPAPNVLTRDASVLYNNEQLFPYEIIAQVGLFSNPCPDVRAEVQQPVLVVSQRLPLRL
jgi:hypothetical protein